MRSRIPSSYKIDARPGLCARQELGRILQSSGSDLVPRMGRSRVGDLHCGSRFWCNKIQFTDVVVVETARQSAF